MKKILTKFMLIIAFISANITLCFASTFLLESFDVGQHVKNYNSLPDLEVADTALQGRTNFSTFLSKAEEVIVSYGFEHHTGLRLIHRHFELSQSCVMAEEFQFYEGTPALVTSPLSIDEAYSKGAVPSGWTFNSAARNIFEFSTDDEVRAGLKDIQSVPDFLDAMEILIQEFHLENLISVSLLRKGSLFAGKEQYYQERTFPTQSIIQILDGDGSEGTRTSWSFGKGPRMLACTMCRKMDNGADHRRMTHF